MWHALLRQQAGSPAQTVLKHTQWRTNYPLNASPWTWHLLPLRPAPGVLRSPPLQHVPLPLLLPTRGALPPGAAASARPAVQVAN